MYTGDANLTVNTADQVMFSCPFPFGQRSADKVNRLRLLSAASPFAVYNLQLYKGGKHPKNQHTTTPLSKAVTSLDHPLSDHPTGGSEKISRRFPSPTSHFYLRRSRQV